MLLAIDVGNTNVVFGIFEGESLREAGAARPMCTAWLMNTPCS